MRDRLVEVSFKGEASGALVAEFDCLAVVVDHGVTRLQILAGDAAALHGVLEQIGALGLELLDVREVG
jgi:hypothetical protein